MPIWDWMKTMNELAWYLDGPGPPKLASLVAALADVSAMLQSQCMWKTVSIPCPCTSSLSMPASRQNCWHCWPAGFVKPFARSAM